MVFGYPSGAFYHHGIEETPKEKMQKAMKALVRRYFKDVSRGAMHSALDEAWLDECAIRAKE